MNLLEAKSYYRTGEIARAVGCSAATIQRYLPRPPDGSYRVLSAEDAQALVARLLAQHGACVARRKPCRKGHRVWHGLKVFA